MKMRKLDWLIIAALSIYLIVEFTKQKSETVRALQIGDQVTVLEMSEVFPEQRLATKYSIDFPKEHHTLINFWATWCTSCEREFDNMNFLYDQTHSSLDIYRLSSYDKLENLWVTDKLQNMKGVVLYDRDNKVADLFNVKEFPQTYVMNPKGEIVFRVIGPMQSGHIEEIRKLL